MIRVRHIIQIAGISACLVSPASAQTPAPFTFTTPVSLNHLHADLTQVRTRCWIFPTSNWQAYSGAIAEAASDPLPTTLEGSTRSFNGEIDLQVLPQNIKGDPNTARSYRCQVELFEAPHQAWVAANELDLHYPIDRSAVTVPETGGLLDR